MENPCLTFVTPTLLAGDRSLANVVAHEIAHSWFGNLVTNVTWEHFWLNEGWTGALSRQPPPSPWGGLPLPPANVSPNPRPRARSHPGMAIHPMQGKVSGGGVKKTLRSLTNGSAF